MKRILPLALSLVCFLLFACSAAAVVVPSYTWRYKLTVEVDTPEGVRTGSVVREVTTKDTTLIPGPGLNHSVSYRGEAVVVNLGERGVLFVLGRRDKSVDYFYRIVFNMFPLNPSKSESLTPGGQRYYSWLEGKREVPFAEAPTMVTFRDRQDPTSVELVFDSEHYYGNGHEKAGDRITVNRFEKMFGAGVKLKRVIIEMTDEPVTKHEAIKWLPWLPEYYDKNLDGSQVNWMHTKSLANGLKSGSFSSEEKLSGR